jgi:hypothetical protein
LRNEIRILVSELTAKVLGLAQVQVEAKLMFGLKPCSSFAERAEPLERLPLSLAGLTSRNHSA